MPDLPRDELGWQRVVRLAEQQRVLGLLAAAAADGTLSLDPSRLAVLAEAHEAWCAHDLRLERALLHAADLLDAASIPFVVIKGPVLAHRVYADPAQRLFADIDLVVPSEHLRAASRLLADEFGAGTPFPELRPGFDERFGKETLLRTASTATTPAGLELDVHRTPVAGALGLAIPLADLFDRAGEVLIAGRAVPTPGAVATLLLACYQASVSDVPPRLASARDVVQLLLTGSPEPRDVLAMAARWQATAVVAVAVRDAWLTLDLRGTDPPELVSWSRSYSPTARERLLLGAHRRPGYVYWRQLAGVIVLPDAPARGRYLLALALPQPSYLAQRRWSFTYHARRAWRTFNEPVRSKLVGAARWIRRRLWGLD